MTETKPIFGLLRRIEDETIRREALTLVDYLKIQTIQGLAGYSKPYLLQQDVTPQTLGVLETLLHTEYQLQFSTFTPKPTPTSTPSSPPRPYTPRTSSPRASGAPPASILESVPHSSGLAQYFKPTQ